jgi:pimeloyl-ACP methyl ester carboxylesterase
MIDISTIDYSAFDQPAILDILFHPRPDESAISPTDLTEEFLIPVDDGNVIDAKLHRSDPKAPTILFFHGNGEIAADYNPLGPIFASIGINLMPVDYRGYGRSSGTPSATTMMKDCHMILKFTRNWLADNGFKGPLVIMGRSLGSASALELAAQYPDIIDGLIVESGFAYALPLLERLGADLQRMQLREENGFSNLDKIKRFEGPTLIIHAEFDHIIPFSDGRDLFDACPAREKKLLKIKQADHNTIFTFGMREYLEAIRNLMQTIKASTK